MAQQSGGVKVWFGYKLSESDNELSGYITKLSDNKHRAGLYHVSWCLYSITNYAFYNDSFLDNVSFDLYVPEFTSKYDKNR